MTEKKKKILERAEEVSFLFLKTNEIFKRGGFYPCDTCRIDAGRNFGQFERHFFLKKEKKNFRSIFWN